MKHKNCVKYIVAAGTAVATAGAVWGLDFLHKLASARKAPELKRLEIREQDFFQGNEKFIDVINAGKLWLLETEHEDVSIISFDGLKLMGHLYLCDDPKRTIIMFHGFRSSWLRDFGFAARECYEAGCNLLIIEQRAHGKSEGEHITYGIFERFDCLEWARYAAERFSNMPIYLDGISMGASTVLMASSLRLPKAVKGIIADCGYTTPKAIISEVFRQHSSVPPEMIVPLVSLYSKLAGGFSFDDYSTLDAMKVNTRPVFFAHGDADTFVPMEMTLQNYQACIAPKRLFIAHGATHGLSYLVEHDAYKKELLEFFRDCEKM